MAIHRNAAVTLTLLACTLAVTAALSGCARVPGVYTYVPQRRQASSAGPGGAARSTPRLRRGIWQSKVLPTVEKDAVDATTLLPALAADQDAASKQYGNQAGTGARTLSSCAVSGKVTKIDDGVPEPPR